MNRTITDLALAGKCGGCAESGFVEAARARSSARIAPKAMEPKPQNASVRNSLRLRVGLLWALIRLIHIQEIVDQKHGQRKFGRRICFQKPHSLLALDKRRWAPHGEVKSAIDLPGGREAGIGTQPLRKGFRHLTREGTVHQLQSLRRVRARFAARASKQTIGRIEYFEERQPEIPLFKKVNAAAIKLAGIGIHRPLGGLVNQVYQFRLDRYDNARAA